MPILEPASGRNLREKILEIGGPGSGKTSDHLSIAWTAFNTGDTRKFYIADTDDEAVQQVLLAPKYDGMIHSVDGELVNEGGNLVIHNTHEWDDMVRWKDVVMKEAKFGDWVVFDFITEFWTQAQEGFVKDAENKSRGEALYEAGVKGLSGWEMFSIDFNWNAINGSYFDVVKTILVRSRAHIFMVAEEEMLNPDAKKKTEDQIEHLAQFGKFKAKGQKRLPYQCRTYLRKQRLARGRVLYTNGKDRARQELNGETVTDFFKDYLVGVAGWTVAE